MREGTSGFWLTENDAGISIEYVDYGVSMFGGGDYEKTYYLNRENAEKFKAALKLEYQGSTEQMVEAAFGRGFKDPLFWEFCKKHGIEYTSSTWSS